MVRTARRKSKTGIYHVMLRGIDKRDLFLDEEDYRKFLDYMVRAKKKVEFAVYGYCLMTNHVHLLLKENEAQEIGSIVKRIAVGYAQYHNIKNGRIGHLFQNRFKSEVIENDTYFLTVLRYIHQNPVKAGIVKSVGDYKWSSYNYYFNDKNELVDTAFALNLFQDIRQFEIFMKEKNNDQCLDYNPPKRYTDRELKEIITSIVTIESLQEMDLMTRNKMLKKVKEETGASNR